MTYEEYIKKNEELTLEEIENKRVFKAVVDGINETHGYNVRNEELRWEGEKKKARANYLEKQYEVSRKKRALRTSFQLEQSQTNVHEDDRTAIH